MRGIGVALISSVSASRPLAASAEALLDPEAVLLVDHREREVAKHDIGLQQRMRADDDRGQARGEARQHRIARPPLLAPGQQPDLDPGRRGEALQGRVMLAREDLGRRHQRRLAAALDRDQHRQQRDDGLAAADIALQQPHHAARRRHVAGDLGQRLALAAGQREAEPGLGARLQFAGAGQRPAARRRRRARTSATASWLARISS